KTYKSASKKLRVITPHNILSDDPAKNMNEMAFGIIQQSEKEVFQGQAFVLEGKVYSQVDILQVEDYTPFNLKFDSELHKLGKSNQVTSSYERVTGKQVETFRIGKTVVFAEEIGIHAIKPFRTNIIYSDPRSVFPQRTKVVSTESTIKVK